MSLEAKSTDHPENQPISQRARLATTNSETDIDSNQCCVCFESYEDDFIAENGRSWIECSCERWLHEDCSFNVPAMPTEFCPFCVRQIEPIGLPLEIYFLLYTIMLISVHMLYTSSCFVSFALNVSA